MSNLIEQITFKLAKARTTASNILADIKDAIENGSDIAFIAPRCQALINASEEIDLLKRLHEELSFFNAN